MLVLAEKCLRALMFESEEEATWTALSEADQYKKFPEYTEKQVMTMNTIVKRLVDNYITRIRNCKTASEMLEKMNSDHKVTSTIGLLSAKEEYHNLQFHPGNAISKNSSSCMRLKRWHMKKRVER